jgi:hypothetical protein
MSALEASCFSKSKKDADKKGDDAKKTKKSDKKKDK